MTSAAAALANSDVEQTHASDLRLIASIQAIRAEKANTRSRVHALLHAALPGGFTDEELANLLTIWPGTLRPTRRDLVTAGMVADSGAKRATSSGALATVWCAR